LRAAWGRVVVNDLGGTMHGEGADSNVADQVVEEIERAGGVAMASHDSVASPEGGEAIVRYRRSTGSVVLMAVVSNAGHLQQRALRRALAWPTGGACSACTWMADSI
jgi:hypothetical protein